MANEFFTDDYTAVLQKLVREVVNDPTTYVGAKYLPSVAVPASKIRIEVAEATGGLTNEHLPGTDPKYVQSGGNRVMEFALPFYKEALHYDEKKILYLRELGQNDPSRRGIRQRIDLDIDMLNRRLEARIEYLRWRAIMTGGFTFNGLTVSFGVPSGNQAAPVTADWSTDGINPNNAANPILDIRYWVNGGYDKFRKYKISKMLMNPNTIRWVLDNSNTRSYVQNAIANQAIKDYGINSVLQFFIPNCPPVEEYKGWYQSQSVTNGKISVGDATYFLQDGEIYFEVAGLPDGDRIGEFVQGVHLAEGSIDSPGYGKFMVVDECIAPGTRGGPGNPFVDVYAGVYGGPKLDRYFDVLTAKVYNP